MGLHTLVAANAIEIEAKRRMIKAGVSECDKAMFKLFTQLLNNNYTLSRELIKSHKQLSDAAWAREGQRDYEQEERGKWGIYG